MKRFFFLLFVFIHIQSKSFAQAGIIDSTFGVNGKFTLHKEFTHSICKDVALTHNGKILVLSGTGFLQRLNADGSPDSTFGDNGSVVILEEGYVDFAAGHAIAVDSINRILVLVEDEYWEANYVFRYLEDGSLDTSFGLYGFQMLPGAFLDSRSSRALAIQADGKIAVGWQNEGWGIVSRLNDDGSFDQGFGNAGSFSFDNFSSGYVFALAQQSDGKLLAAGVADSNMLVARFNYNGQLDSTFGTNGYTLSDHGNLEAGQDLTQMQDGKILVVGHTENADESSMLCWRFLTDGSPDYSFGDSGVVTIFTGSENNFAWFVFPNKDTTAIVGGSSFNGNFYQPVIYHILKEGSIDSSYGENGIGGKTFVCGQSYQVNGARTVDEKIVLAGTGSMSGNDLVTVSQFSSNGITDSSFAQQGTELCPVLVSSSNLNYIHNFLTLPDSNILCFTTQNTFRITTDGVLDSAYGENGFYFSRAPFYFGSLAAINGNTIYAASTIVADHVTDEQSVYSYGYAVIVRKLNIDGTPDTSYGTHGILRLQFMNFQTLLLNDIAPQPNNKLLLLVTAGVYNTSPAYLLRLNADGSLDQTFGNSGSLLIDINRIALRDDGKINCLNTYPQQTISRLLTDGSYDATFGNAGVVMSPDTISSNVFRLQADNKMLLQAGAYNLRLNEDGTVDSSFGSDGYAGSIGGYNLCYYREPECQPDGKILVSEVSTNGYQVGVARYKNNGDSDSDFGVNGLVSLNGVSYQPLIGLQSDGKILAASGNDSDFVMIRLLDGEDVSVPEIQTSTSLQIFPNPAYNKLIIKYSFSSDEQTTITVRNITGKVVGENTGKFSSNDYSMDVNELPAGIYLLTVQTKNNLMTAKFVKE